MFRGARSQTNEQSFAPSTRGGVPEPTREDDAHTALFDQRGRGCVPAPFPAIWKCIAVSYAIDAIPEALNFTRIKGITADWMELSPRLLDAAEPSDKLRGQVI